MSHRILLAMSVIAASLFGQTPKAAPKTYSVPKTPWGDPDLQGLWPATASIPMQRPANMGTRAVLTDEEVAQRREQARRQAATDSEQAGGSGSVTINPPSYWVERGPVDRQASPAV